MPEPALGLAAVAATFVVVAALAPSGPAIVAPMTPPVSNDPATAAPTRNLLIWFISFTSLCVAMEPAWRRPPFESVTKVRSFYESADDVRSKAPVHFAAHVAPIGKLDWVEVDNHDDLARAREIACHY